MALIKIEHLKKSFDGHGVLRDVNLQIEKGDILAIIGGSGSGKSTIIRCLTGLESIDSGEIYLNDMQINHENRSYGKIGMVFQNFNLFPHYTVLENISKPLETVKKIEKQEALNEAKALLSKVRLEEVSEQYPSTLSGGQKQRLAVARSLAMKPSVIAFDEPTSSLDPELANEVFRLIQDLAAEGQTMIIVTHQINAIRKIATKVAYLREGVIEVFGLSEDVFTQTENKNLNDFLNMVEFGNL